MTAIRLGPPPKQGLYDPQFEHDACGVGFIVDIKGKKSNAIVKQGIQLLKNLDHRGASGSEVNTGDGAGMLIQMPHAFLKKVAKKDARINLPEPGMYAAGNIFMPRNATQRRKIEEVFARVVQAEGQVYLGARSVLISPLCAMQRYGCARSQLGNVLVLKRECTIASVHWKSGSVRSG